MTLVVFVAVVVLAMAAETIAEIAKNRAPAHSALDETQRYERVVALAERRDERSLAQLTDALRDPSEAVALAAAHALLAGGNAATVERVLLNYDDTERAVEIARDLDLLAV